MRTSPTLPLLLGASLAACGAPPADGIDEVDSAITLAVDRDACLLDGQTYDCHIDVAYGPDALQRYDLWVPRGATGRVPVVVFVHGGGYFQGSKDQGYGTTFDPRPILDAGFAYATIDYRLSGDAPFEKGVTGEYPPAMVDGGRALQHLRARSRAYGIDPARVAITGSSAGGGISLWLAFHDDLADPNGANAVARASTRPTCVGVTDTQTTLDISEVEQLLAASFVLDEGLPGLYGFTAAEYATDPAGYDRRFAASYFEASPIRHLSADDQLPVFLAYILPPGSGDIHSSEFGAYLQRGAPRDVARAYGRTNLRALGIDATLTVGGSRRANNRALATFLTSCFDQG